MPTTDCPHGYTSALSCVDCMEDGNLPSPPPQPQVEIEYTFTARHAGPCGGADCTVPIDPGHHVAKMTDGTYRHLDCVDG